MNRFISAVREWFGSIGRASQLPSPGAPVGRGQAPTVIPILLASERDDDYRTLQALLQNTKWTLERPLSWGEVSDFCDRVVNPVVLVDRHYQGSDWRFTISSILNNKESCCLILLSDVSDPYLWDELVQQGGFDVLARPFEKVSVHRTLAFAHRHFEAGWPPLHPPQENGRSPA